MYWLGIDLGGTNIAAGVVNEAYEIVGRGRVKTRAPRPANEIADDMAQAARLAIADAGLKIGDIAAMGIGSPGAINPETGVIATANNLQFDNVPLCAMMKERMGVDFYLENDASAAAYGEFIAGAGRGTQDFVAITLGTGVGGGILIDGKLYSGFNYAGGELGHMVICYEGEPCTCGRKGCWEAYSSATALIRQTKAAMQADKTTAMWEMTEHNLDNVSGRTAFDAMRRGDAVGQAVVDQYIRYLACGLSNVINIFQPEILCIGGGISREGETLIAPVRALLEAERYSRNVDNQTQIKAAELGNDAGIIGAAFLCNLH